MAAASGGAVKRIVLILDHEAEIEPASVARSFLHGPEGVTGAATLPVGEDEQLLFVLDLDSSIANGHLMTSSEWDRLVKEDPDFESFHQAWVVDGIYDPESVST
jgi:hypothetical protein